MGFIPNSSPKCSTASLGTMAVLVSPRPRERARQGRRAAAVSGPHRIRLAVARDAGAIATMSRDLVESGLVWRYTPARVLALVRHPDTNVAVAETGGATAGFGVMEYGDERGHLVLLAVRRSANWASNLLAKIPESSAKPA